MSWLFLALFCSLIGYEELVKESYGDNSVYAAIVLFGIAALALRLVSAGPRTEIGTQTTK